MIRYRADRAKNRLYIALSGKIEEEEARGSMQFMVTEVHKLQRGFDVITDFSGLVSAGNSTRKVLRGAMDYLAVHGVSRVVRIVGGAKAMLLRFADFSRGFKAYAVHYVPTMADAEKKLDSR